MSKKRARKPPQETPSILGWRIWFTTPFGGLMSTAGMYEARWTRGIMGSTCLDERLNLPPHDAPGAGCLCGVRILDTCENILNAIEDHPAQMNCALQTWYEISEQLGSMDFFEFRERYDALWTPDVIGVVYGYGRIEPGNQVGDVPGLHPDKYVDPRGTLRVERARVGDRLYVARHLTHTDELRDVGYRTGSVVTALKRLYPKTKVHVGSRYGAEWIDEIAEKEGLA
jgi:hypothetical protein